MSGTTDPAAPVAPVSPTPVAPATEPGPQASGTPAPASSSPETPASFSPEPAPVPETPAADKPTSIMSEAAGESPEPAPEPTPEEKPEPEAAKPEDAKPEEVAPEPEAPKEPLPPPVYEAFTVPEGVTLAEDKVTAFNGLLGEFETKVSADPAQAHAAFQELGQKLIDFYAAEAKEHHERTARLQRENWDRTIDDWQDKFRDDPEIGRNRQDTTISRIGGLLSLYGQQMGAEREQSVRDAFGVTGAGNHPEVIRYNNWMASRLTERPRTVTPTLPRAPVPGAGTKAQRLYRNTPGAA